MNKNLQKNWDQNQTGANQCFSYFKIIRIFIKDKLMQQNLSYLPFNKEKINRKIKLKV